MNISMQMEDTFTGSDEGTWRLSPVAGCDRQAGESEGRPQRIPSAVTCTHTAETHWRATATSVGLTSETITVKTVVNRYSGVNIS